MRPVPFDKLIIFYPIGRHIAVKHLKSKQMKFIKLSNSAKEVTALEFNSSREVLTVAVKHWEFEKYDKNHLKVYFYNLKSG